MRRSIARNKPYDQIAHERLADTGFEGPSRYYSSTSKARPIERVVSEDMRVFLGRRFDCAQCHDHPFEPWTQDQFWGLASFYGRLTLTEWIGPTDNQVVFDDPDGAEVDFGMNGVEELQFIKVTHPRKKFVVDPTFLDGTPLAPAARDDARAALAAWVTSHPYFAEAIVNRMWKELVSRGFVEPIDDFRADNPPTCPQTMDFLAQEFVASGYSIRSLIEMIVRSDAYARANAPGDAGF